MARDGAYREAAKKIEAALRSGARSLDLSGLKLTELPESLGQLTQLQHLYLADNQLTTVPESLGQLTQLQLLNLSSNALTTVPEWLGQLTQLQILNLSSNALTTVPESLGQLTQLQFLDLSSNALTTVPESLGQLTQLQLLFLFNNQLTTAPEWLGQLTQLQHLYLADNLLTTAPESLGQLTQLQFLDLSSNQLTTVPESLGQLTQLQVLDLSDNALTTVPEWLGQLTQLQFLDLVDNQLTALPESIAQLTALRELYLHGNVRLNLPDEILGPKPFETSGRKKPANPKAIFEYYFSRLKRSAQPLNEVKLLLVGHGRVGKTSLSKALRGEDHNGTEPETPGIERHLLPLLAGKTKITAHIWDFGGQEFLHQTHQFFFSKRSIYLVVLSGRQGGAMREAEYWLRLIRTYGTGSPVVIALNQSKTHPFDIDAHYLRENYPEIQAVVKTDCDPRCGIEPLKKQLGALAGKLPSVREKIAPEWARIRTKLENMAESFVTFDRYREICAQEGVSTAESQETLATILDCLGIALNYREDSRLRDKSVLKPRWLVDGIYTILRWMHKQQTQGELRLGDFPKALKSKRTYPLEMHGFLLALMEKFELCFPIETGNGHYLVPGLLNENQPTALTKFTDAKRIEFRYRELRPPNLLPRFIVRSHTLSHGQTRWRHGVVLARGKARVLVRGDHDGRVTEVFVVGENEEDRVWLTEFVLAEMANLHDKLPVETRIASETDKGAWTELEVLRTAAQNNETTRLEQADGRTVAVNIRQTLQQVESSQASKPDEPAMPLFICYSHDDAKKMSQLLPSLRVLVRRGYIAPWRDTDLVPGEDWDETIKERLTQAKIILYMVSRYFLASKYITEQERPLSMAMHDRQQAIVVPVLLRDCTWQVEDFSKLENLPCKGKLVTSYSPRDEAWKLIEEGIVKAVERARLQSPIHHVRWSR